MQIAARFAKEGAYDLVNTAAAPPLSTLGAVLIIPPGNYSYNSESYDCTNEGLHTFWNSLVDTTNRIVYQSNVYALMSGLSWLTVHGTSDEALTQPQLLGRARTSRLRLRCGPVTAFVRGVLNGLGIPNRQVRMITMGTPTNFDDGHVALEVKINGTWRLFDVNNSCFFTDSVQHLNLRDAAQHLADNTVIIEPLDAAGANYEVQPFAPTKFEIAGWWQITFGRPDGKIGWLRRIYQGVGVYDDTDGKVYWRLPEGSDHRAPWVQSLSTGYVVMTRPAWDAKYYP